MRCNKPKLLILVRKSVKAGTLLVPQNSFWREEASYQLRSETN